MSEKLRQRCLSIDFSQRTCVGWLRPYLYTGFCTLRGVQCTTAARDSRCHTSIPSVQIGRHKKGRQGVVNYNVAN